MRVTKVRKNQSIFDVAVQEYGNIGGAFFIVEDNNLGGVTDNLHEGRMLKIREVQGKDKRIRGFLSSEKITTVKGVEGTGIGYWEINRDFTVQ